MSGINLTSAMRSNLLTLQGTQTLIGATQNRLATGLKVSSALDNPQSFFQAQALNNRASDLTRLQDNMGLGVKTLEAAANGIKAMTKIAENMSAIGKEARDTTDVVKRADLQTQFEDLREQLARMATDSGFNGINLLAGEELQVNFNEENTSSLTINGGTAVNYADSIVGGAFVPATEVNGIGQATAWNDAVPATGTAAIDASLDEIKDAIADFRTQAAVFGSNLTTVKIREDFTKDMINTLKAGADGLVLADQNEEAANLLALQTSQQLGIQALSLASQSQQGILRLF